MHNNDRIYIPYAVVRDLIKEGDLLLYRGNAWYSYFIKRASRGEYSHIGIASWHNGHANTKPILETIEFHGYRDGGVSFHLSNLFPEYSGQIDVYRPSSEYEILTYNKENNNITIQTLKLNPKAVTQTMRELTGLPYGWRRIWWFVKSYLFGFRFFYNVEDLTSDELKPIIYPVCSTAIAYAFTKNNFKLIHEKADEWTQPSDLAESPLTNYLFTIV